MRTTILAMISVVITMVVSSCSTITVDRLPQPGNSFGDGYNVVIEFGSALNLPDHAKVIMDGATVGIVDRVALANDHVDVTARIDPSVTVPTDTRAGLQQATVLGDIYVALDRPTDTSAPMLAPNGRIPLTQTTSPPQLEDTIASLANFVGSGSIQRIQNTVLGINRVTPDEQATISAIAARMSTDLADLSHNVDTVDLWLNGVAQTVQVVADRTPQLQYWFTPAGMRSFDRASFVGEYIGKMLPSVGSVYNGGYWLIPLLKSLGYAMGSIQKTKWAVEGEYRPWREFFTDTFLPQDKYPAMNITSVQTSDGREISTNVEEVLRMLGAVP